VGRSYELHPVIHLSGWPAAIQICSIQIGLRAVSGVALLCPDQALRPYKFARYEITISFGAVPDNTLNVLSGTAPRKIVL